MKILLLLVFLFVFVPQHASWTVQAIPARIARGEQATLAISVAPGTATPESIHVILPDGLALEQNQASTGVFLGSTWTFTRTQDAPALLLLFVRATAKAHRDVDVTPTATWNDAAVSFALAFDSTPPHGCMALYLPMASR